ncbi:MAG: ATP-grasp domain-containing protein [Thermotogota bacterium]
MKIYEFVGKKILKNHGINIPNSQIIKNEIPKNKIIPSVIKSQVLVGGRMKLGGVLFAQNEEEYVKYVNVLLAKTIKGEIPHSILAELMIDYKNENYLSIYVDREERQIKWIFSSEGGIEIENSKNIIKGSYNEVFIKVPQAIKNIMPNLYNLFIEKDLTLLEINPLVITANNNKIYALDCVMEVDDNALYRQEWINEYNKNIESSFHYVELDGNIGIIGCGAGIVMATMDMISEKGLKPANFLDIGGGADKKTTIKALKTLYKKGLKTIVMNIFGGITKCDLIAESIVDFKKNHKDINLLVRMTGNGEKEGTKILKDYNIKNYDTLEDLIEDLIHEYKKEI